MEILNHQLLVYEMRVWRCNGESVFVCKRSRTGPRIQCTRLHVMLSPFYIVHITIKAKIIGHITVKHQLVP